MVDISKLSRDIGNPVAVKVRDDQRTNRGRVAVTAECRLEVDQSASPPAYFEVLYS